MIGCGQSLSAIIASGICSHFVGWTISIFSWRDDIHRQRSCLKNHYTFPHSRAFITGLALGIVTAHGPRAFARQFGDGAIFFRANHIPQKHGCGSRHSKFLGRRETLVRIWTPIKLQNFMPQASPHILVAYKTVGRFDGCSQSVLWNRLIIRGSRWRFAIQCNMEATYVPWTESDKKSFALIWFDNFDPIWSKLL